MIPSSLTGSFRVLPFFCLVPALRPHLIYGIRGLFFCSRVLFTVTCHVFAQLTQFSAYCVKLHFHVVNRKRMRPQRQVLFHLVIRCNERTAQGGQLANLWRLLANRTMFFQTPTADVVLIAIWTLDWIFSALFVVSFHLKNEVIFTAEAAFLCTFGTRIHHMTGKIRVCYNCRTFVRTCRRSSRTGAQVAQAVLSDSRLILAAKAGSGTEESAVSTAVLAVLNDERPVLVQALPAYGVCTSRGRPYFQRRVITELAGLHQGVWGCHGRYRCSAYEGVEIATRRRKMSGRSRCATIRVRSLICTWLFCFADEKACTGLPSLSGGDKLCGAL